MSTAHGKQALHVATFSGWYRFEQHGKDLVQTRRDLSYWTLTCMAVDEDDRKTIYAGTEHSGLFYTKDAGAHWHRADPQVPKMFLYSALALDGGVMVGTIPSAVYRSNNGGWEELAGVRLHSAGATFPPSPELQSRTRYLTYEPGNKKRLYAGIEVGGMVLSDDGGRAWEPCNEGLTDMDIHEILASRQHSGMVFLACGESCFRSRDRAAHWENISPKDHDYGISVAEDKNGVIYVGAARGRPNLWVREQGAMAVILRSDDKGASWQTVIDHLNGGVMHFCPMPDGTGMIAGTSDGTLLRVDDSGARQVASGLPFVTSVALGA